MNLPPPIPDPFAPLVKTPRVIKASYAPIIVYALLVFGALWTLSRIVPMWLLFVVGFVPQMIFAVGIIAKMQRFTKKCDGVIGSRAALDEALKLIDRNMKGAYTMMIGLWPLLAILLFHGRFFLFFPIVSLIFVPLSLWSQPIERKFKALLCDDAELSAEFADALRQLKAPQFGLKPFVQR